MRRCNSTVNDCYIGYLDEVIKCYQKQIFNVDYIEICGNILKVYIDKNNCIEYKIYTEGDPFAGGILFVDLTLRSNEFEIINIQQLDILANTKIYNKIQFQFPIVDKYFCEDCECYDECSDYAGGIIAFPERSDFATCISGGFVDYQNEITWKFYVSENILHTYSMSDVVIIMSDHEIDEEDYIEVSKEAAMKILAANNDRIKIFDSKYVEVKDVFNAIPLNDRYFMVVE